jgi:hypothetical protein
MWRCVGLVKTDVSEEGIVRLSLSCPFDPGFFYIEDDGDTFLWNVVFYKIHTAPRRHMPGDDILEEYFMVFH